MGPTVIILDMTDNMNLVPEDACAQPGWYVNKWMATTSSIKFDLVLYVCFLTSGFSLQLSSVLGRDKWIYIVCS